tara:strand:+ start:649 stop:1095 length:447 start_codon:yes stop_codon:yes gene_type:complete
MNLLHKEKDFEIYSSGLKKELSIPYFEDGISAGFPSPADDFLHGKLDLNEYLINNPSATYYVRVLGDSMANAGIASGSLLIVDKSIEASNGKIVVAFLDKEFTVKRIKKIKNKIYLKAENAGYEDIEITSEMNFEIFGVVTHSITKHR